MKHNGKGRVIVLVLFCLYGGCMLWLLLGRQSHWSGEGYLASLCHNINLIPFHTNLSFLKSLFSQTSGGLFTHAFINLMGNVILFIPLGVFLPVLWKRLRRWWPFFGMVTLLLVSVELAQLFLLRGICDVDDYLLNVFGASAGFLLTRIFIQRRQAK